MWVCWQNEERDGKSTKVPWSPTSNGHASSIDPSTWSTRAIAEGSARANGRTGIGIEFVPLDEDRHLGGIDLDACIDDEGNVVVRDENDEVIAASDPVAADEGEQQPV